MYLGANLPPGSKSVNEAGRFISSRSYADTIDFYERTYGHNRPENKLIKWIPIAALPGIRATHIQSISEKTLWEGINVYETSGTVKIFVLAKKEKS